MKRFDCVFITAIVVFLLAIVGVNIFISNKNFGSNNKEYRVDINRIEKAIDSYEKEKGYAPKNLEDLCDGEGVTSYEHILTLEAIALSEGYGALSELVKNEDDSYQVIVTDDYFYKVTYRSDLNSNKNFLLYLNLILGLVFVAVVLAYFYLRNNILKPFNEFTSLPYELAKGNLNKPLEESKNKYFGKFIWGMNMLRENLEESKAKELEAVKEKKVLLLSLSHDIKTPLNAISLYAKAISKNLYKDEERKKEVALSINDKVYEIEKYMSDIVKASSEEFLTFEVENTEVYVGDVLEFIGSYYKDKTSINSIDFKIGKYSNCLISGDKDRIIEVIQNIVENAIKYGDGRRIWIDTQKEDDEYVISLCNTGCTMPDDELAHIFDSFFRGTNVGNKNGSGLGLYICRELMHLMEGEILANIITEPDERIMEIQVILKVVH